MTPETRTPYAEKLIAQRAAEREEKRLAKRAYFKSWKNTERGRQCTDRAISAWRTRNPDKCKVYAKRSQIKRKYGITLEERMAMLDAQGGVCAACMQPKSNKGDWTTDHCHDSGKVRGILCTQCNTALGLLAEDPERIRALALYIEKHNPER